MDKIKKIIQEFTKLIGVEIEEISSEQDHLYVNLKAFGLGEALEDIQYLLRKIIKKQTDEFYYLNLDINGFKKKKEKELKQAVQVVADRVALLKEEKVLNPMSSYERRIIHLELEKREDVKTESVGEGKERKVIIRPS